MNFEFFCNESVNTKILFTIINYLLILFFSCMKELQTTKEEHKKATAETERLLQLVQMSQEEQNAKEKTIMDLQQ